MKTRVLIAVPTLDRKVSASLAHFLCKAETANADPAGRWEFSRAFYVNYRPVDFMRNSMFRDCLDGGYDMLWMMDADIEPPHRALELLETEADIVGGVIPGVKAGADGGIVIKVLAFDRDSDGVLSSIDPLTHSPHADAVAGGCMAVHRRVLEDPRMRYAEDLPTDLRPPQWAPAIYRVQSEPWGGTKMTGDVDFCIRAKECGYTVAIWPDEMFGQMEQLDLRDVAAYGARCAASARGNARA